MKKLIFYFLAVVIFLSCDKKNDPEPTVTLKAMISEGGSSRITSKSVITLIYENNKLRNLQRMDTVREVGLPMQVLPVLNNIITEDATGGYKLSSDFAMSSNGGVYTVGKIETITQKNTTGYNLVITVLSNQSMSSIELNASNQLAKVTGIKNISTSSSGVKTETPQNWYVRNEYDAKGNVIKVFQKANNATAEVLAYEYIYDENPNPYYNDLRMIFRLMGATNTAASESKNNVVTSKVYKDGVLSSEITVQYTYDNRTGYPLTAKSFVAGTTITPSTVTFKY